MFIKGLSGLVILFAIAGSGMAMEIVPVNEGTLRIAYEQQHHGNMLNGFMLGFLLAFMVYNLYLYIVIKDLSCLYSVGYLIFALLFLLTCNGYISHAVFSHFGLQLVYLLTAAFFCLLAGYASFIRDLRYGIYSITAFICLLISYGCYAEEQPVMGLQLGLCMQALVLSFALAIELNNLKKETGLMQRTMIAQTAVFSKELIIGQEKESESIALELNNSVGQQLVLLKNELFVLKKQSDKTLHELFNGITDDIGKTIEEISNVSSSLRPYQLDTLGLKLSIERLVEDIVTDADADIVLEIGDINHLLDKEASMNVYRIVQELFNNLIKHAQASDCKISIKPAETGYLILYYSDNGKGYDTNTTSAGLGLAGIDERCQLLHANLTMSSILGKGTRVYIKIPLKI